MAAPSQTPTGPEYEQSFLRILTNQSKYEEPPSSRPRERGFVVLVRGGSSLKPLQELCLDPARQSHNTCYTARYRLQPKMAVGTLLAAWVRDFAKIYDGQKGLAGDLQLGPVGSAHPHATNATLPEKTSSFIDRKWSELASRFMQSSLGTPPATGEIRNSELNDLLEHVSNESVLAIGDRLILFAELGEEATDVSEWNAAAEMLFTRLPERMGMVVLGAPKEFILHRDDPHFLEITVPQDYGSAAAQVAYRYIDSSFHSDQPATKDELDVNRYANAIARFVLHPQTTPPLTIGIHGPWGKGKSSFMDLIDSALVKYAEVNRAENTQKHADLIRRIHQAESLSAATDSEEEKQLRTTECEDLKEQAATLWEEMKAAAEKNVLPIWFNAWRFEDAKQTWAGLAAAITERMEELLPGRTRQWLKFKYAWKERKPELILNVLLPFGIFCIVLILFGLGLFRGVIVPKPDSGLGGLVQLIVPAGSIFLTIWFVASQFIKVAQPVSERVLSYVAMPNYRDQMGFQHRVRDDVKFVSEFLETRLNTSSFNRVGRFRVVVYIDDLDRCSESKIMELLQAINLILADCKFFVFVGMDTEMIYRAIKSYYKENVSDRFADNYLSKVIQISFYLPDTRLQTRAEYLGTLFSLSSRLGLAATTPNAPIPSAPAETKPATAGELPYDFNQLLKIVPVQVKEAEDTSYELQAFSDYCEFIDDNPREIKRLINIHRLIKILVQNPTTPLDMNRQRKLVKWLIFCDNWPQLVGYILERTKNSDSQNCLLDLATALQAAIDQPQATSSVPAFDGLKDFAVHVRPISKDLLPDQLKAEEQRVEAEKTVYALSAADIDEDFRLAAKLSLMVRKPVKV